MSLKLAELCTGKQTPGSVVVLFQKQNSFSTDAKSKRFNFCLTIASIKVFTRVILLSNSYHIDELCDG